MLIRISNMLEVNECVKNLVNFSKIIINIGVRTTSLSLQRERFKISLVQYYIPKYVQVIWYGTKIFYCNADTLISLILLE